MSPDSLTTPIGLGATLRFTHPDIAGVSSGHVEGRVYTNTHPWLVVRCQDRRRRVVGLHEVVAMVTPAPDADVTLPVFKARRHGATAETPTPAVVTP